MTQTPGPATAPDADQGEAVLVLNTGSSSVKFMVVHPQTGQRSMTGLAERIGSPGAEIHVTYADGTRTDSPLDSPDHLEAVRVVLEAVRSLPPEDQPTCVGHRVVHGGDRYSDSVVITDEVVDAISDLAPLAPLHNPPALQGIRAVTMLWPELPQVAVFDTAFHQSMPPHAYRYAVPDEWVTRHKVRRYGFHGTSYRYVSERTAVLLDRPLTELALVVAHLGNGSSAAAIDGGVSVDTTMGLTPMEGLVMGTRSGDIDPGVFPLLAREDGQSSEQVADTLNRQSGLLGLSGVSSDMRQLQSAVAAGDTKAALAIDVFCYRVAKTVAALVVALGRLDALVFTGGIGENDADVRDRIVTALEHLGMAIDEESNAAAGAATSGRISDPAGRVDVLVVPTDEELMIARDARRLTAGDAS